MLNKKAAAGGTAVTILIILLAVFMAHNVGLVNLSSIGAQQDGAVTTGDGPVQVEVCADPSNTMTIGPQKSRYAPSTSMSSVNARLWVNGVDQGSKSDSSTYTVGEGDEVELVYGFDDTTYYASYVKFIAPCRPFSSADMDGDRHKLYVEDDAYTINVFPADTGDKGNRGLSNESMAAGETGIWTIKIDGANEQGISPDVPGREGSKMIFVFEFNGTTYDNDQFTLSGVSGISSITPPDPAKFSTLNTSAHSTVAFAVPGQTGKRLAQTLTFTAKADDDEDPDSTSRNNGDIDLIIYTQEWKQHTKSGDPLFGHQDNLGDYIGSAIVDGMNIQVD